MTETELLGWVLGAARELQLLAFGSIDPRRDVGPGFPTVVMAGPRGQLFAHLKATGGRLAPEQQQWRYALQAGGGRWHLWRPVDWISGQIEAELRALAVPWI